MRILMMSNTYAPIVGGLEASIGSFSKQLREQGNKVVIVAPTFEEMNKNEEDVVRIPAIQNFLREEISLTLPIPIFLLRFMREFEPDIIHSHHFFGVGDMALRLARQHRLPLVYTHHIMLEEYAKFFPLHNEGVKRFVLKLATGYANLTDCVIAPSLAVRKVLERDGVNKPIRVIPTGIDVERFARGDRKKFREKWHIPTDAFVIGFVGRLNPEKNLEFLSAAAARFLKENPKAYCLVIGEGILKEAIENIFQTAGVKDRLRATGVLKDKDLVDGYHAMDIFIFSSHSETQGIVLTEAMAAGKPVVAVNAPAVREIVKDGKNGRLLGRESEDEFIAALSWFAQRDKRELKKIEQAALATAGEYSIGRSGERLLDIYHNLKLNNSTSEKEKKLWDSIKDGLKTEKDLLINALEAAEAALKKK